MDVKHSCTAVYFQFLSSVSILVISIINFVSGFGINQYIMDSSKQLKNQDSLIIRLAVWLLFCEIENVNLLLII